MTDPVIPPFTPSSILGVFAPASAPLDDADLSRGLEELEKRGVRLEFDSASIDPAGFLSASDEQRANVLNGFLSRTDLSALCAVRGGYGSPRILARVNYDEARTHPKLLIGFSDITALHFAFYSMAGWKGIQGPMVAVDWKDMHAESEKQFWDLAAGRIIDPIIGPAGEPLIPVTAGSAEGILLGGNLTTIARLVGTPYLPSLDDAILYLEDIGEAPYRLDAVLAQLNLAGVLDRLAGVVLGEFTDCDPSPGRRSFSADEVLMDYFEGAAFPVAKGLVFGHMRIRTSMPFGVAARLSVSGAEASLSMLEPVTRAEARTG